ncbi:MAG: hypothetical protein HRS57_02810, partial [Mycoplasmataceae bacterium]|nr:hypothetical protein [Mycoplasmataceae bacterium]
MKKEIDPISKLKIFGTKKLTDTEILSILIYSGNRKKSYYEISKKLIEYFGSLKLVLQQSIGTLIDQDGMTEAKAMQLVLINEVTDRVKSEKSFPYNITEYSDVIDYVYKNNNNLGEFFSIIFLDSNERYLGHKIISESLSNKMNVNILEIKRISVYNNSRKVVI